MQERMFPIGTHLTHRRPLLCRNAVPQNRVADFLWSGHFSMRRLVWALRWQGV